MGIAEMVQLPAAITQRYGGIRLKLLGNAVQLACHIGEEPSHLVHVNLARQRLQDHLSDGLTQVVAGVAIDNVGAAILVGDGDHQDRCMLRPGLITFLQYRQHLLKFAGIVFRCDDKAPGL